MKKIHSFDLVYDAQKLYRLMLEAFANPGRKVALGEFAAKMYGAEPAMLSVALTLLDNEVSFHTAGIGELAAQIQELTLARETAAAQADYIFVTDLSVMPEIIREAKCGTLTDPHKSAVVIIWAAGEPDSRVKLCGPGIDKERMVQVPEAVVRVIQLRQEQFYEYPQGIDLVFVLDDEELMALPRLVRQEVF